MAPRFLLPALVLAAACAPSAPPAAPAVFGPVPPGPETTEIREARERLIAGPVAKIGVTDPRVLDTLRSVDRRVFLPPELWPRAWEDGALRRPDGETLTAVDLAAAMLAALEISPDSKVLECGTRSGWLTALLARAAKRVFTVAARPETTRAARRGLCLLGVGNVSFRTGDPGAGWPEEAPFDAVLVNGRVDHVPRALYAALRPGGRILAPVGPAGGSQTLVLSIRGDTEPRSTRALLSVRFAPLR
ncbi:MAG: protein-L-isoaspartate O-methyltransferase [Planctomycetes bacterium]|nr:protein-L-isoaspartate O-methyltransferase [Planctomycetota bacterium]